MDAPATTRRIIDGVAVRPVEPDDVEAVAACLTRAFAEDPVARFLFPAESTYARRLERYFAWQLRGVFLPKGEAWTTEELEGAALWMPPRTREVSVGEGFSQLATAVRLLGVRTFRAIRLLERLESLHPKILHAYLGTIGTDPDRQGHGIGSSLMRVVLDRLDVEDVPAYLESSKEENLAFYGRLGFTVTGEVGGGDSALPRIWLMWREPAGRTTRFAPQAARG